MSDMPAERTWPDYPFPGWDGKEHIYLVQKEANWPLFASTSPHHAIDDYERLMAEGGPLNRVRIWKVTAIEVEEVALQQEIVRKELVPKGMEVTS